jgi:hypothetical protein
MEILFLTSTVSALFVVFFIATYREIKIDRTPSTEERGPRAGIVNLMGRLFDDRALTESAAILKALDRTISDMESEGVYFSDGVKAELQKKRDELYCEYSGLPSVAAYEN